MKTEDLKQALLRRRSKTQMPAAQECVRFKNLAFLGYENYRIGSDGSVWSKARGIWKPKGTLRHSFGYRVVSLWKENKEKRFYIHHLVLLAFVGPCPKGMQACHDPDNDPANNKLENLRWDTPSNNNLDKAKHGNDTAGERSPFVKFTESDVREIRTMRTEQGLSESQLAKIFGMTPSNIHCIITRKTWKHI